MKAGAITTTDPTDSCLLQVGRVASNWARFETVIDMAIWHVAKIDDHSGACITSQITGVGRKLDALISLMRYHHSDDVSTLKCLGQLITKSHELGEKRNRTIHDQWRAIEGLPVRLEITARKRLIFEPVPVSVSYLSQLADDITDCTNELFKMMRPYLELPDDDT